MESINNKKTKFTYKGVMSVILIFLIIAVILFLERSGINYNTNAHKLNVLSNKDMPTMAEVSKSLSVETLLIWDSNNPNSRMAYNLFDEILNDMKIGCNKVDLAISAIPDLNDYSTLIVALSDLTILGNNVLELCDWTHNGGQVLFAMPLEKTIYTSVIERNLGIIASSYKNTVVDSIYIEEGFMIGGGRSFNILNGFDSAWTVQLSPEETQVYMTTDNEKKLPLIWKKDYGNGNFVVVNFGLYEKNFRGFYSSALSLLSDVSIYPVINGSVFYLDDFPSQIPNGNSEYILRDYNTSIRDFYMNIWWPDMMSIAEKYNIRYTGLAIECYDDSVDGTTQVTYDKGIFTTFGNMLLRQGGEIGYHGYNHQPLCLDNCDYKGIYNYKTWHSTEAMKTAFDDLIELCNELFPDVEMTVYVPPSNLLSKEGKEFIINEYPNIKTLSGIYFIDDYLDFSYVQEFGITPEGVVEQPRIISGCVLTDFMEVALISELNMHYVNSHFTHPDDALDIDRGAEMGWEKLKENFDNYLDYLYTSAPSIRNFTASEMSAAIQRFVAVKINKKVSDDKMTVKIDNFYDDAQFFVRFNDAIPDKVMGGKLTHLTGDLYLLSAKSDYICIYFK